MFLEQDESGLTGHYKGIKLFNRHNLGQLKMDTFSRSNKYQYIQDTQIRNITSLNTMLMNCRSIREYLKRILVMDILRSKKIDLVLLQETFLIKEAPLYFNEMFIKTEINII